MPTTQYTFKEQQILDSFQPLPNYSSNSFTFYNKNSGKVIVDAIRTDDEGNLIFKDVDTEIYLKDIVTKSQTIEEEINEDGNYTLYFSDKFNSRYSLGEIYKNLFASQPKNLTFWFGERASRYLDDGMDSVILDNYLNVKQENNLSDPLQTVKTIEFDDTWKNKWIDIPCLEVITPDYVNNKYASITASISFKMKADKPLVTGFRIYDATAGIELTRVIHTSERSPGKFITYTVPLHYQGPLPDTDQSSKSRFTGLTYQDIQNIQIEEGEEIGKIINKNANQYESIPETQHVIKLQWITCDVATEIDHLGQIIGDFGRLFDERGETSLDVTIFSDSLKLNQIIQLNGTIDTSKLEEGITTAKHVFDVVPLGLGDGYSISFATNKNVNVSISEKTTNGFSIEWFASINGLTIDWSIAYKITQKDIEELESLNDPKRPLNHYLFPDPKISIDFCNEITNITDVAYDTGIRFGEIEEIDFQPTCVCCDCCDGVKPTVTFVLITGSYSKPSCNNDEFYMSNYYTDNRVLANGDNGVNLIPPLFQSSSSSISVDFYEGQFNGGTLPIMIIDGGEFFEIEEIGDMVGVKDVSSLLAALSAGSLLDVPIDFKTDTCDRSSSSSSSSSSIISSESIIGVTQQKIIMGEYSNVQLQTENVPSDVTVTYESSAPKQVQVNKDGLVTVFKLYPLEPTTVFITVSYTIDEIDYVNVTTIFLSQDNDFGKISLDAGVSGSPNNEDSLLTVPSTKYEREGANIKYYEAEDDLGNTRYAPDPRFFKFLAVVNSSNDQKCDSGIYVSKDSKSVAEEDIILGDIFADITDYEIKYDNFDGYNTDSIAIQESTVAYSQNIIDCGFGAIKPFFRAGTTYYLVTRASVSAIDPIFYLFDHENVENVGSLNIIGKPGKVYLFSFLARIEDPTQTDGKDFVVHEWTPVEDIDYADLHLDDNIIGDPIELVALLDRYPFIEDYLKITNAKVFRDMLTMRETYIEHFPELEDLINKFNILSGEDIDVSLSIPLSGQAETECAGLGYDERFCTALLVIEGMIALDTLDDVRQIEDYKLRFEDMYGTINLTVLIYGRAQEQEMLTEDLQSPKIGERDFALTSQKVVGVDETVWVVKIPNSPCEEVVEPVGESLIQDKEVYSKQKEWLLFPDKLVEASKEEKPVIGNISYIKKKTITLSDIYQTDYTYSGLSFDTDIELLNHFDAIERAYDIGLENLKYDIKQHPQELPAQNISDSLININIPFDSSYSSLFDGQTLKVNDPTKLKTMVIITDGFLGVKAFKHNIVVFDPNPNVIRTPDQRPIFPGFDPIYQKRTKEEILEYIYTAVYPTENIPAFPNFRINDIAINGEIYNPLFDYRNYRLLGYYDPDRSTSTEETFISTPMKEINGTYVNGLYLEMDGKFYILNTDFHNSGNIITSRFGNKILKVKPSKLKFDKVSETLFNFNRDRQIQL